MAKVKMIITIVLVLTGTFFGVYYTIIKNTDDKIKKLQSENELILKNNKLLDSVRATYKNELDLKNLEIEKLQVADQLLIDHVKTIDYKIKSLNTNYEKANTYSNNFGSNEIKIYFADSLR